VIGAAGTARDQSPLSREDVGRRQHQHRASESVALEQLVRPLQSTAGTALIPFHQVAHAHSPVYSIFQTDW